MRARTPVDARLAAGTEAISFSAALRDTSTRMQSSAARTRTSTLNAVGTSPAWAGMVQLAWVRPLTLTVQTLQLP